MLQRGNANNSGEAEREQARIRVQRQEYLAQQRIERQEMRVINRAAAREWEKKNPREE